MKQMENFRKAHALVTVFRTSKIRPAVLKVCIWRKDCNFYSTGDEYERLLSDQGIRIGHQISGLLSKKS